jgi:hypothetical protein
MKAVEGFNHGIFRGGTIMKKFTLLLVGVATLAGVVIFAATTSRHVTAQEAAPIFVKKIPPGYRDWRVVSVAHEAGELNDIRAVLGNDIAIKAYRERQASVSGRHNRWPNSLELRLVRGKQQKLWP